MTSQPKTPPRTCEVFTEGADVRVVVAGAAARLRVSGALWLEAERALVVADVHLEKGSAYAARGPAR